jgi:hypothetical protein
MGRLQVEHPFTMDRLNGPDDYCEEWDVPSLGKTFTDAMSRDIDRVRARPDPEPERKVHLFAGQAGYGKTHLFGRMRHQQADRVQFVFIPAPKDASNVHGIAIWPLIETLFVARDGSAPIRAHLSRLLTASFVAYFDQLAPGLKAKISDVQAKLESDPLTVLKVCAGVSELACYHHLADAVRVRFPNVPGAVVRALVLSLSPASDDARWWLRGEAEQVPEDRLAVLRLPAASPSASEVIHGAADLLRTLHIPLVLCFDQLEVLFEKDEEAFREMTSQLMGWLQTIPNLVIAIGCFSDLWRHVTGLAGYRSFVDRVTIHKLHPLSPDQAAEFIERRMKSWIDYDPDKANGWPFELDSARRFVEKTQPSPRGFTQEQCRSRFDDWLLKKRQGLITLEKGIGPEPISVLFTQEWAKELEATKAEGKTATDSPEGDIWAAVDEAIHIARIGQHVPVGMTFERVEPQPLKPTMNDTRPSAMLTLASNGRTVKVIVAASKKDGGTAFGHWLSALEQRIAEPVIGSVVVWPREQLSVGRTAAAFVKYQKRVTGGTIRPFPLDANEATFAQLECLRRITLRAAAKDLVLNNQTISVEECRKLIVETGAVANLKFFQFLFENWSALPTTPAQPSAPSALRPSTPLATPPEAVHQPTGPTVGVDGSEPQELRSSAPAPAEVTWAEIMLKKTADYLKKRGQSVHPVGAEVGPAFVRLKLELRGDADFGKVRKQWENLKLHLALENKPLIASQAGYISVDVQRPDRQTVFLAPLLATCPPSLAIEPTFLAGVDVAGRVQWLNLSEPESCHLLVAGTTGSGKSEFLKAMLAGLAAHLGPEQIRFRLIDPKRVTFNLDPKCAYLGGPVVYDASEAIPVLEECFDEMERRYDLMQKRGKDHVRQLTGVDAVPRWLVVFDEFADLMVDRCMKKELEPLLKRLGAKARASGIHLVLGTQRPEASVVTPLLRSNLPGRIGLQVATERESKLFLDEPDAAYLFGKGDLVWKRGGGLMRLQSPFVPKPEFDRFLRVG